MAGMSTLRRIAPVFALLAAAVLLCGCPPTTPTSTPVAVVATPPQITVANAVNALAQAVDGAVTSSIAARDAGKVSQADLTAIEGFCSVIATTGKQINVELRSTDAWPDQKIKILTIVSSAGLGTLKAHISPGAGVMVVSLVEIANQISTAVGGPII